uniref:Uncharacterized protein n=1 Tax=Anguilla anguilla TaxID=7936 RepID=A0A0E9QNR0_ANGAN
MSVSFHLIF